MQICCPVCSTAFPIEAGFVDGDGKQLASLLAGTTPAVGRAAIAYLGLFKPAKSRLSNARAVKLCAELLALIDADDVAADERTGQRRKTVPAVWVAGIEQMLTMRDRLTLPVANHNYLRKIVFDLAGQQSLPAPASEPSANDTRKSTVTMPEYYVDETPLQNELGWLRQQLNMGRITVAEHNQRVADAMKKYGGKKHHGNEQDN